MRESEYIEFKESWRDNYLRIISAFANTNGGQLFIGIKDNGEIVGVKNSKRLVEDIPNKVHTVLGINIQIKVLENNGNEYIEIFTPKMEQAVSYKGRYYIRSGSTTQELKGKSLESFILHASNLSWDEITVPEITWADMDEATIKSLLFPKKHYARLYLMPLSTETTAALQL